MQKIMQASAEIFTPAMLKVVVLISTQIFSDPFRLYLVNQLSDIFISGGHFNLQYISAKLVTNVNQ